MNKSERYKFVREFDRLLNKLISLGDDELLSLVKEKHSIVISATRDECIVFLAMDQCYKLL